MLNLKRARALCISGVAPLIVLFAITIAANAADPPIATTAPGLAAPLAPAGQPEKLEITITGVEGIVQVRTAEDQPWKKPTVGMKLDQGAEFRTGPRSAVRFVIPPDQTVTLDRLGTVKVLQAVRDANKVKTDLGMKYGRMRYDIEAAGVEHQSNIMGPGSTLAVRGTKVSLYDQPPFEPQVVSLTGRAIYENSRKARIPFGAKGRQAAVTGDQPGAASHEIAKTHLNPISLVDSDDQQRLFFLTQRTTAERFGLIVDTSVQFAFTQSQMTPFSTSNPLGLSANNSRDAASLGSLVFDLTWTNEANVNLIISTPAKSPLGGMNELLASSPFAKNAQGNLNPLANSLPQVFSGGKIDPGPFDALQASPQAGRETAYWPTATAGNSTPYPTGNYTVKANLTAGSSADVTLSIYQNGTLLEPPITGVVTTAKPTLKFPTIKVSKSSGH